MTVCSSKDRRTASKCRVTSCVGESSHFPLSLVVFWLKLKLKRCWAVAGYEWENKSSIFSCPCSCGGNSLKLGWQYWRGDKFTGGIHFSLGLIPDGIKTLAWR